MRRQELLARIGCDRAGEFQLREQPGPLLQGEIPYRGADVALLWRAHAGTRASAAR